MKNHRTSLMLPKYAASCRLLGGLCLIAFLLADASLMAQSLDEQLRRVPLGELVTLANQEGDAARGAVVFFQRQMACSKCHAIGKANEIGLGPDLTALPQEVTNESIVESVLLPSKAIRKGYESVTVVTQAGVSISAILVEQTPDKIVMRDVSRGGETTTLAMSDVDTVHVNDMSIMPPGQVNQLNSRQQFLDLLRYLFEIREGGALRAKQLQPSAALLAFTVPEYEDHLDHAGLIGAWNASALERGAAIYERVCVNCHGTTDRPGSLPTSLRFADGKFKNGSDPLSMYRTLTHGFGLMAPQSWMVPSQKYDVIHYIRETYLKPHNATQFVSVDAAYLASLPAGDTRGPEPSKIVPWSAMDYGPSLTHTYEVPGSKHNFAYKGVAVRLDSGAGGVSRGRHWMMFDTDTLRVAAAWNGSGESDQNFIDWRGIQFNGAHNIHPRVVGPIAFQNSDGPGWGRPIGEDGGASAKPVDGSINETTASMFVDDRRVKGRDGRRYGPLPRDWGRYRGMYLQGQQVVFSYTVGTTEVLESPGLFAPDRPNFAPLFLRTFNIGPRETELILQVAEHSSIEAQPLVVSEGDRSAVWLGMPEGGAIAEAEREILFDGNTYLETPAGKGFNLTSKDFTIAARIRTKANGTIWSLTQPGPKWIPDGQTFFVRDGRLGFDIGWVGAVSGKKKINDGDWHQVAVTWESSNQSLKLYVDGKLDSEGKLAAKGELADSVVRIGFTAPNFPQPASFFDGEIEEVRFHQRCLQNNLDLFSATKDGEDSLVASWKLKGARGKEVADSTANGHVAQVRRGDAVVPSRTAPIVAGFAPRTLDAEWFVQDGSLRLVIPPGSEPLKFSVWLPSVGQSLSTELTVASARSLSGVALVEADRDLQPLTQGGPPRWGQKLETQTVVGTEEGPFATDIMTAPETNPWLALTRFTGLDFFDDGRMAICSWDGDVWIVEQNPKDNIETPATGTPATHRLRWQRVASGMFQPLGLKIVDGKIHVTCRDQLAVLHDLNGDGEIDFYECLNNDHQVTDHFHEFAMGLQTDAEGNFYYAKSGLHGLPAVVPHHGTLLKVSRDGSRTDILANGFRAANGVCLNPDGSFVVTDQEGFWNPKNRINWVTVDPKGPPKFYGNMLGYHDIRDESDSAMEPPLCWITNAFDRSPGELLWVDSERWGKLNGSLLNLSYGYGKVFLVPHEKVQGTMQGGMIELPIPTFPTGVMRGRFSAQDHHLYLCGMFAWAGNATYPGGLYRLRATGQPMHLPLELHAESTGLRLTFAEPLDPASLDQKQFQVKVWSLKRTKNYGSKHFDEQNLEVIGTKLSEDRRTVTIEIKEIRPTWCMEIQYSMQGADGTPVQGTIHNTIHHLNP